SPGWRPDRNDHRTCRRCRKRRPTEQQRIRTHGLLEPHRPGSRRPVAVRRRKRRSGSGIRHFEVVSVPAVHTNSPESTGRFLFVLRMLIERTQKNGCPISRAVFARKVGLYERISTEEASMFEGIFQPMHLIVIAGIALLIFGSKKLPELGK